MKQSSIKLTSLMVGLWIVVMLLMYADQLSLNSAMLVSLVIANLGWTLKLNNDMNENRTEIRLLMQRIEDHLDLQDEKNDRH